jgi:hypothetical protein
MINELQRQAYLSALGIENYMPRMILPFAPSSITCEFPVFVGIGEASSQQDQMIPTVSEALARVAAPISNVAAIDLLADVSPVKKSAVPISGAPINAATILEQFETKKTPSLAPFALSLWRPVPGFLIVDSRNTGLALPTELLLNNLLRAFLVMEKPDLREEVMRWPMIENRFVSRTANDARNELQTWLAVENELRPINRLWLMGDNAARYLLSDDINPADVYWQEQSLGSSGSIRAVILPSLNELLQQPLLKARFWASVK